MNWQVSSRRGIVLNVGDIGYEVQLLSKHLIDIDHSKIQEIWIHQIEREDCTILYGFKDINQRNLFRKIISVNGIGPQIGMALLEDLDVSELIYAIEENDLNMLTKSQGIGKRIAERLILDLKNKLQEFIINNSESLGDKAKISSNHVDTYFDEIKSILKSLGYLENEINDSLVLLKTKEKEDILHKPLSSKAKNELIDNDLKEILLRISQRST